MLRKTIISAKTQRVTFRLLLYTGLNKLRRILELKMDHKQYMAFTLFSTNGRRTAYFFFMILCKLRVYTSMGTFSGVRKLDKPEWTPLMEQALNVIYFLAEHPEKIAENLVKKIAACLLDKTTQDKATSEEEQGSQDKENGKKNPRMT